MERLFKTHCFRKQECLDGQWDFRTIPHLALPQQYNDRIAVPSCWEMNVKYCQYTGCAAYKKTIEICEPGNVRFIFKGVSHTCIVYLDGKELGKHYSAYSAFSVVACNVAAGIHILEILVDNRYSENSKLHIPNDYFTYGGITRPVFLEYVSDSFIERLEFVPYYQKDKWYADLKVFVNHLASPSSDLRLSVSCAETECVLEEEQTGPEQTVFHGTMQFDNIEPWTSSNPVLYHVKCTLYRDDEVIDDYIDRTGFRTVSVRNRQILLNGQPVFLKGVNRHEDHGSTGCAIPLQLMYADIALIKDLGANAIRTSHYQNDERFLDLCDENGILVWEESHDRGGTVERLTHPLFIKQSMDSMHEMLQYHHNHPSIIIWGCLNEAASNDVRGRKIYKKHFDYLTTDPSRLHTYASNKHTDDLCMDLVDICSVNIYPKWYDDAATTETLARIRQRLSETQNDRKPLIISEYGAGGIYNFHDIMRVRWSEEYQADLLEEVTHDLISSADIAGLFIWQFCDTRIKSDAKVHMRRPNSRNNKGLVDEFRRPKQSYYIVKKLFNES